MNSLRRRLLFWLLALLTGIGGFAGAAAFIITFNDVSESLDQQLKQIAFNVGKTDQLVSVPFAGGGRTDPEDEFVITISNDSGKIRSSNPSIVLPRPYGNGYQEFAAAEKEWRAYSYVDGKRTVQVAQRMTVRDELAASAALSAILPIVVLLPLSWLLVGWVIGRVLRPLHAVTDELRLWGKGRTQPLSLHGVPVEILPLTLATNDLITRLQTQLEFRQKFISDAAHELRTPLTALRLQANNLHATLTQPEQKALLGDLEKGLRRMSDMISQMLKLARTDSLAERVPEIVDLNEIIVASLQSVMPIAERKALDIGLIESVPAKVFADPEELRILLGNLVENAVRYTPDGGVVDLSISKSGPDVIFEVRDTGPGIPESLLERVFDRFFRVAGSDTEGSGLGLPIVRAIAERYGARIALVNRDDRNGLIARVWFSEINLA